VLILVLTTLVWGTTFPLVKDAVATLSPAILLTGRFLVAALVFAPALRGVKADLVRDGIALGLVMFLSYLTQAVGLQTIGANRAAFITGLNVILVPLAAGFLGHRIRQVVLVAAVMALGGVSVLSFEGGQPSVGDLWTFGCAATYAAYILMLDRVARKHDPARLTAVQLVVVAVAGLLWSAPSLASSGFPLIEAGTWLVILYLGVIATAGTTLAQALGQRLVPAAETAVIYSLEPVFATVFSWLLLGEVLGLRGALGAALVLAGMVVSQLPERSGGAERSSRAEVSDLGASG
jgi:drug/metabolite transporter (DMT)-like permease